MDDKKKKITHTEIEFNTEATRISEGETLNMKLSEEADDCPASLLLLVGPKELVGVSWSLVKPITTIGRSNRLSDVSIKNDHLSKSHFQISKKEKNFYIRDLNSTNKTYLNEEPLEAYTEIPLKNNSHVRAGHVIFKFLEEGNIESISSRQLLDKAQRDSLTGAGNRQYLKVKGVEFFKSSHELSLVVFDVNNFKHINDTYGHLAGDFVLKTISQLAKEVVRGNDTFFRYGGDEFCIFIPSSFDIAKKVAERLDEKIKNYTFSFEGSNFKTSLSIGVAQRQEADKKWQQIYARADKDCYQQKEVQKKAS